MAWKNEGVVLPKIAASAFGQYVCLANDGTTDSQVFAAASCNVDVIGVSIATVPTYGLSAGAQIDKVAKVLVVASVGAGARVMVASSNGGVGPLVPSGFPSAAPSGPAGLRMYSVGVIQEARGAGEYGSVHIDPREIV